MMAITAVTAEAREGLAQRDVYVMIRTSQGVFCSKTQPVLEHRVRWDMAREGMVVTPEENHHLITLQLWDYDKYEKIGKLSLPGLAYGDGGERRRSYTGFIMGKKQEEIRVSIDYEWIDAGRDSGEAKKGRETKRTDYTNRQSNNSLISNLMEPQPTYAAKLYSSLLRSLSERHIDILQANSRGLIAPYKSPPKKEHILSKRHRQIA